MAKDEVKDAAGILGTVLGLFAFFMLVGFFVDHLQEEGFSVIQMIGICLGIAAGWFLGSVVISSYINASIHRRGSSGEWMDEGPWFVIVVLAWPIALPLILPVKFADWLGAQLHTRVHHAELIKEELAREGSR